MLLVVYRSRFGRGHLGDLDVAIAIEPTFFCMLGGLLASGLGGAKAWLHIQDFEIDAAFELGILPSSSLTRKLLEALERWLMERFDCISTISEHGRAAKN